MKCTYEELLKYDINEAIELKGKDRRTFKTAKEWLHAYDDDPAKIPNNPLLTDYNWVYENAEKLFYNNLFDYQQYQGVEEYYTLFKALTNKYSLEEDYQEYINKNLYHYDIKWGMFAIKLIEFISHAFDEKLKNIMDKENVINYFLRYPAIYTPNRIEYFNWIAIEKFLSYPQCSNYYREDFNNLVQLIRKNPKIKIPTELILDSKIIKDMSRTYHIEEFYFNLCFISEQIAEQPYLDEHKKFCDEEIKKIKNGILPCYQENYNHSQEELSFEDIEYNHNFMEKQVIKRIFEQSGLTTLPKKYIYQELSKYMIIGMFMSRNYETDPFNLLIDINTLYEHAIDNNRNLQGLEIYAFLHDYESKTINEIIDFYNKNKNLPLKEMLYDDWENEKQNFISELNDQIINIQDLQPQTTTTGTIYYDISNIDKPIIVHNTSIPIDDKEEISKMIDRINNGNIYTLSLSIQDKNHTIFHEKEENKCRNKKTIKLAYGKLTANRVGMIHHTDAYSIDPTTTESENFGYKREMHTVQTLMDNTTDYNELTYVVYKNPLLPIGIICEDEITKEEIEVASKLNIPILFRNKKENKIKPHEKPYQKGYQYTKEKGLF